MCRTLSVSTMICLFFSNALLAQSVITIPKPGAGQWDVSYTRMFEKGDPQTGTELKATCATLAEANNVAAGIKRWSQSMNPNSEWRVKKIYIEGENATAGVPNDAAPKTASLFEAIEEKMERDKALQDSLRDLGGTNTDVSKLTADILTAPEQAISREILTRGFEKAIRVASAEAVIGLNKEVRDLALQPDLKLREVRATFSDYLENVSSAYKRAKVAKDDMIGLTGPLAERKMKEVNTLVDKFNREANNPPQGLEVMGRIFPGMKRVSPETIKQVAEWKEAKKLQFDLENKKVSLDLRKVDLDQQRAKLDREWTSLQSEMNPIASQHPKVISLRKSLENYQTNVKSYNTAISQFSKDNAKLSMSVTKLSIVKRPLKSELAKAELTKAVPSKVDQREPTQQQPQQLTPKDIRLVDLIGDWQWVAKDGYRRKFIRFNSDGSAMFFNYGNPVASKVSIQGNRITFSTNEGWTGKHGVDVDIQYKDGTLIGNANYHNQSTSDKVSLELKKIE